MALWVDWSENWCPEFCIRVGWWVFCKFPTKVGNQITCDQAMMAFGFLVTWTEMETDDGGSFRDQWFPDFFLIYRYILAAPNILSLLASCETPNSVISCLWTCISVLGLNIIVVLSLFILWPEASSCSCRIFCSVRAPDAVAFRSTSVSSAKKRWLTRSAPQNNWIPSNSPFSALLKRADRPSAHIINRYGGRGSPWRRPRCGHVFRIIAINLHSVGD